MRTDRPLHISIVNQYLPVHMISNQRNVQHHRDPFASQQEDAIEDDVQHVFGQDQLKGNIVHYEPHIGHQSITHRIEAVALIDGVLVIRLQLVKDDYMEDGKEYEHSVRDQGDHVRDGRKVEGHVYVIVAPII